MVLQEIMRQCNLCVRAGHSTASINIVLSSYSYFNSLNNSNETLSVCGIRRKIIFEIKNISLTFNG